MVLYPWSHFLPVNCRKSRSNSFSIFKRWISYWHSSIVLYLLFLGRPLRFGSSPAAKRACSRLCRLIQFLICTFSYPNVSAISCRVRPAFRIFMISVSTALIFVHFRFSILLPPDVVLLFSYIRGAFVYCPVLLELFMFDSFSFSLSLIGGAYQDFLCPFFVICRFLLRSHEECHGQRERRLQNGYSPRCKGREAADKSEHHLRLWFHSGFPQRS